MDDRRRAGLRRVGHHAKVAATPCGHPCGPAAACSGSAAPGGSQVTNAPTKGADATEAAGSVPAASDEPSGATTTVLPAECAEGLGKYLVAIEPLVAKFDPAKDTLGALYKAEDAAGDKAYELLQANNSTAPYSCSEVGLEWAYFDAHTPWDAVLWSRWRGPRHRRVSPRPARPRRARRGRVGRLRHRRL